MILPIPLWPTLDDANDGPRTLICETCTNTDVIRLERPGHPNRGLLILSADGGNVYNCSVACFVGWLQRMMPGYRIEKR